MSFDGFMGNQRSGIDVVADFSLNSCLSLIIYCFYNIWDDQHQVQMKVGSYSRLVRGVQQEQKTDICSLRSCPFNEMISMNRTNRTVSKGVSDGLPHQIKSRLRESQNV